jgi:hypothetical protein
MLAVLALALLVHRCLLQTDAFAAHQPAMSTYLFIMLYRSQFLDDGALAADEEHFTQLTS